jgi:hypothetical protein
MLNAQLQVLNTQSQVMINQKFNGNVQPALVNVSSLKPGLYFLRIVGTDGRTALEKFVKQ